MMQQVRWILATLQERPDLPLKFLTQFDRSFWEPFLLREQADSHAP